MAYTTIDDPSAYFQTTLYSGTGSEQSVTNGGNSDLQPDWVWLKVRSNGTYGHALFDSVRGVNKVIGSNTTNAEENQSSNPSLSAFNSDGFTVGGYYNNVNQNGQTFASWQWKAGTAFSNDASSTGVGSIDSAGSVSTDAGFSIIKYTGTGSAGTIAHGLAQKPTFIIVKEISGNGVDNWKLQHSSTGAGALPGSLNLTDVTSATGSTWNSAEPTSAVFSIGTATSVNTSSAVYICYIFSDKQGYSKTGSFEGNGNANGPFIYTGFKPAFVLIKNIDATKDWKIIDNKRNPAGLGGANPVRYRLAANTTAATSDDGDGQDFTSQGFKIRTTDSHMNTNANTHVYLAFAESPFVTSTGVPTTAQ
jgi:hypothetical protein